MKRADYLALRVSQRIQQRGTPAVLRRMTGLPGPQPAMNPPQLVDPVVHGAVSAGAAAVSLRASTARGRLVAGDKIIIGAQVLTVGGTIVAANNQLVAIPVSPVVGAGGLADGQAVNLTFAADQAVSVYETALDLRLFPGTEVQQMDSQVMLGSYGVTPAPRLGDHLRIGLQWWRILAVSPRQVQGAAAEWALMLRQ
jgi:hypothetical protein